MGRAAGNRRPRRRNEPWGRVARPPPATHSKWVALPALSPPLAGRTPRGRAQVPVPRYSRMILPRRGHAQRRRKLLGLATPPPAETGRSKGRQELLPPLSLAASAARPELPILCHAAPALERQGMIPKKPAPDPIGGGSGFREGSCPSNERAEWLVKMRLLIIEDDRDAADYLVKAFREVGHIADQANDGEEGQAMALDGQYDVLIVDRMLPKRDGLSIIHTLRSKSIETPVLILSALGQVDDRVKGLRTGGERM